jgi:Flp pilus assembly protein TadG
MKARIAMPVHRPRRSRGQRGVAAVELGFMIVPLVLLIFGTTELGRAIYTYNTLDKAVRDAARHLSQHGPGDATIRAQALCLATTGVLNCNSGTPRLAPGLQDSDVVLCDALSCAGSHAAQMVGAGAINLVSVTITGYDYDSLVEFVIPDMAFNGISATMRAQL